MTYHTNLCAYRSTNGSTDSGADAEFRLHGIHLDEAEANARTRGYIVLAGALDKPHGLREAYILDPDGYCWVPDVPLNNA